MKLLTPGEEQVVALVADGLSQSPGRARASIKRAHREKYRFRIFDKLGISSRVELVRCAVSRGRAKPVEWVPAG